MKLIIINGPCGVGKSTAAAALHASLPLSFLLDIDAQRRFVSGYQEHRSESGDLANVIAFSIAETCLKNGRDVIVEKMIFDEAFLNRLFELGKREGAQTHEFILWAEKEVVMQRAEERGYIPGSLFTPEKCERFWEEINELKTKRPDAIVIDAGVLNAEQVLTEIQKNII